LGDRENSVYGENADAIFAGELTNGDSNAMIERALLGAFCSQFQIVGELSNVAGS
jgi:hypothetical protein